VLTKILPTLTQELKCTHQKIAPHSKKKTQKNFQVELLVLFESR